MQGEGLREESSSLLDHPGLSVQSVPLRFNYEFSRVYKRGKFSTGRYLTVHCYRRPAGLKHNLTRIPEDLIRVGFCANKKQLGAVGRNRARRLMRESYRLIENGIPFGNDLVFTLRNTDEVPSFQEISKDMVLNLTRLGLLKDGVQND